MATFKLEHLLPQMKQDFAAVCKAANVDLPALANDCVSSGKYPTQTIWAIFNEVVTQKQSTDDDCRWAWRAENGGIPRVLPFVHHSWQSQTIYNIADDSHIDTLLRRVLVSFANPDIH